MGKDRDIALSISIPLDMNERLEAIAKRLHAVKRQIMREGVIERITYYENKFREDDRLREEDRLRRESPPLIRNGYITKPLGPLNRVASRVVTDETPAPSPLDKILTPYASQVLAAQRKHGDGKVSENEIRRLVLAATNAVTRMMPLTHPPDTEIVAALERLVVTLRDAKTPTIPTDRSYDDLVGAVVDAARVKTRGDVEEK